MESGSRAVLAAVVVAIAALAAGAGCELTYDPEVGPLVGAPPVPPGTPDSGPGGGGGDGGPPPPATGPCVDSDPTVDVSFSLDLRPLISRSPGGCSCHSSNVTSGFNLGSYARLRQGGINSGTRIVTPGAPCDSVLVQKLGLAPPFGSRMPYNGPPYFTAEELTRVKDWIAEGAHDN